VPDGRPYCTNAGVRKLGEVGLEDVEAAPGRMSLRAYHGSAVFER
jgi:hypothetical protein